MAFAISFFASVVLAPFYIKLAKKIKFGQNILHYVESHSIKAGTPTMGGVIFVAGTIVGGAIFFRGSATAAWVALSAAFAFGVLGFLDDYIKIKQKRNLGLRAWQKLLGQILIGGVISWFAFSSSYVGGVVVVPFTDLYLNLGWVIIPFAIVIFIATTNSVNLTDGLDGLAANCTKFVLFAFGVLILLLDRSSESVNLAILCFAGAGALMAFNLFNVFPAKIFMGDAGSLALGALVASVAIFSRLSLFLLFFGLVYIASSLSVIIQVLYFKKTKGKRVFLMAPLHHHFEKKGNHENRIVAWYTTITVLVSVIVIFVHMLIIN